MNATTMKAKHTKIAVISMQGCHNNDERVGKTGTRKIRATRTGTATIDHRTVYVAMDGVSDRKMAQMRRDIFAKAIEANTANGFVCTTTGSGSYAQVNVFRVEQVETTTQTRGVCQGCGGDVAIVDGVTSLHGYKRPGHGWTEGRCSGAQISAANVTLDHTHLLMFACTEEAVAQEEKAAALDRFVEGERAATAEELHSTNREEYLKAYAQMYDAKHKASANRQFVAHLEAVAIPALGTAYRTVAV